MAIITELPVYFRMKARPLPHPGEVRRIYGLKKESKYVLCSGKNRHEVQVKSGPTVNPETSERGVYVVSEVFGLSFIAYNEWGLFPHYNGSWSTNYILDERLLVKEETGEAQL
ncbi:MAG: hypothetical protein M1450_04430 [Patescibacteria group bacterium]|nr:hypothetical protein [Patescibacteria group bacterium]